MSGQSTPRGPRCEYAETIVARYHREFADSLVAKAGDHPGMPVTLTGPSGTVTGRLVGVAYPSVPVDHTLTAAQTAHVVISTGHRWELVPVAQVTHFQVQTR